MCCVRQDLACHRGAEGGDRAASGGRRVVAARASAYPPTKIFIRNRSNRCFTLNYCTVDSLRISV